MTTHETDRLYQAMRPEFYVVIHECPIGEGRTDYGIPSMLHETRGGAENALAYCEALQEKGRPGTEGRYYIAKVVEES